MKKLIIADSSSLTENEAKNLGVRFFPLIVTINGETFKDYGQEELRDKVKKAVNNGSDIMTSLGSIGGFTTIVENALKEYDEVIFLGLSKGLSNQHSVLKQMEKDYKGLHIIDTRSVCFLGYEMIKLAKKMADNNVDVSTIQTAINDVFNNSELYAIITNLDMLKKGGRMSPSIAKLAGMLKIKPLIYLSDAGKLEKYGKCRTIEKGIKSFSKELVKKCGKEFKNHYLYVSSIKWEHELTNDVVELLYELLPDVEIKYKELPNVILSHTGDNIVVIGGVYCV